jgi:hypothetical protein
MIHHLVLGSVETKLYSRYLVSVLIDPPSDAMNGHTIASAASRVANDPDAVSATFATVDFDTGRLVSVASVVERWTKALDALSTSCAASQSATSRSWGHSSVIT